MNFSLYCKVKYSEINLGDERDEGHEIPPVDTTANDLINYLIFWNSCNCTIITLYDISLIILDLVMNLRLKSHGVKEHHKSNTILVV